MLRACILAIIAGYADTVGLLRFDAFAGLMTGNTVLLGIALAEGNGLRALHYSAIILVFFVGVLTSRLLLRSHYPPALCLTLAAASLVVCTFYGMAQALILAFAMGTQNAAATRFGRATLNTVFITGNLQKFGEGLIGLLWPGQGRHAEAPPAVVAIYGLAWLFYAVGALFGALGHRFLAWPLLVPAAVLPFVLLRQTDLEATPGNDVRKRRDADAETSETRVP